jgi:RNA polymerase sigma-70 factor (ECF subfamily)
MCEHSRGDGETLEKYRDFVLRLAHLHLNPRLSRKVGVEDLAQETLLRAHKGWAGKQATEPGQVKSWLRTIFLHCLWDALKNIPTEEMQERTIFEAVEDSSNRLLDFLKSPDTTPGAHAQRNESARLLEEAMYALPDRQREAVRLKHLQGWTVAAISAHLETTNEAVAGLLHRGLTTLNQRLTELE